MTNLTKKGAFVWTPSAQQAFDKLKEVMSSYPVLAIPDFSLLFVVECDASDIGVLLMQNKHPITFESRKLKEVECKFSIYDKEMLAIMHALTKFRQCLVCNKFLVKTDHNSLKYLPNLRYLNDRQQKWVSKILAFDFDIEYIKGNNNVVADALSRKADLFSITEISADWRTMITAEYVKDPFANDILYGKLQDDRFRTVNELILYEGRVYITPKSKMKDNVLKACHDTPLARHPRFYKTYKQVREHFTWKGLKNYVMQHVR